MIKNKQSTRSLIAFLVTWSFLILTVTGIVLYIIPQGRVAYWTHWSLAGLEKEQWSGVHMIFGGLFIITGILHLVYNWKPFKKYLMEKVKGEIRIKQELVLSLLLSLVILVMSIYGIPPVSWVFDLNETVKDAWVTRPELEPPFGHAEEVSVKTIARRMELDYAEAVESLRQAGIEFAESDSLETLAQRHSMTPMEVYGLFSHLKQQTAPLNADELTAEEIEAQFAGTGVGRKSIAQVCQKLSLESRVCIQRLAQQGITANGSETLRELAENHGLSTIELLKQMLIKH